VSYWFRNDNRLPQERLAAASYVIVGMITLLLLGFWKLQVIDSDKYGVMAERNRVRSIPIIAPRGRMLDRDGRVLVDNYPSFSVLLLRDDMAAVEKNLPAIADGLGLSLDDLKEQLSNTGALPKFQPIVIKPEATQGDVAFIESHRADIPLLEMLMVHRRRYLPGGFMAHASGYVGEVSEQQIEASNGKYRPGDVAGKSGLERQYNDLLVGTDGMRRVIVNSIGKEVGRLTQQEAIPGKQIQLTIDYDLQQIAEEALAGKKGAVVALDPSSGEVLAFVSRPAPDPNDFAIRVSKEEWQRLNSDADRPLLNRVTQAQLAPGSVFKIVMATAMLEEKVPPESYTSFCPGYATFYGRQFQVLGLRQSRAWCDGCPQRDRAFLRRILLQHRHAQWASIELQSTRRCWGSAPKPELTCPPKNPDWFLRKNGFSGCFTANGIRAKQFPFPSDRER